METMTRSDIIARIQALTDEQVEKLAPLIESDLDVLDELEEIHREIDLGRKSAHEDPLLDHDVVMSEARARLRSRA